MSIDNKKSGGAASSSGDGDGVLAADMEEMVERVKKIVINVPDSEIVAMLIECEMEPDEAAGRLLSLGHDSVAHEKDDESASEETSNQVPQGVNGEYISRPGIETRGRPKMKALQTYIVASQMSTAGSRFSSPSHVSEEKTLLSDNTDQQFEFGDCRHWPALGQHVSAALDAESISIPVDEVQVLEEGVGTIGSSVLNVDAASDSNQPSLCGDHGSNPVSEGGDCTNVAGETSHCDSDKLKDTSFCDAELPEDSDSCRVYNVFSPLTFGIYKPKGTDALFGKSAVNPQNTHIVDASCSSAGGLYTRDSGSRAGGVIKSVLSTQNETQDSTLELEGLPHLPTDFLESSDESQHDDDHHSFAQPLPSGVVEPSMSEVAGSLPRIHSAPGNMWPQISVNAEEHRANKIGYFEAHMQKSDASGRVNVFGPSASSPDIYGTYQDGSSIWDYDASLYAQNRQHLSYSQNDQSSMQLHEPRSFPNFLGSQTSQHCVGQSSQQQRHAPQARNPQELQHHGIGQSSQQRAAPRYPGSYQSQTWNAREYQHSGFGQSLQHRAASGYPDSYQFQTWNARGYQHSGVGQSSQQRAAPGYPDSYQSQTWNARGYQHSGVGQSSQQRAAPGYPDFYQSQTRNARGRGYWRPSIGQSSQQRHAAPGHSDLSLSESRASQQRGNDESDAAEKFIRRGY